MSENVYNPNDRFRNLLKRKSSSRHVAEPQATSSSQETFYEVDTESCPAPSNPFKVTSPPSKRRHTQVTFSEACDDSHDSLNIRSCQKPTSPAKPSAKKAKSEKLERFKSFDPNLIREFHAVDFSHLFSEGTKPVETKKEESETVPLDLRIGRKIRIVSKTPFPWMSTRKTTGIVSVRIPASERFTGMKYFNEVYLSGAENLMIPMPSSNLSVLEAATLYWQYPVVPGMSLYPRITSELGSVDRVPLTPSATTRINDQWVECFEQLFMSYKKGERDSFYVASAVFNVLFTKTAISDEVDLGEESQSCFQSFCGQKMVALVTHTTTSTREHLRNQGVDYEVVGSKSLIKTSSSSNISFPSQTSRDGFESKENSMSRESPEKVKQTDVSSDENDSPTKSNNEWLKNIGVSPRQIRGGNVRRKLSMMVDRGGISCLVIRGTSVQSLYNLLMSSEVVHEKTGPFTKIPPTLIATSPFIFGQLLSLNKSSQVISKVGTKSPEYVLELDGGPIIPHCVRMVTMYIRNAKLCGDVGVTMQVSERHSCNGMNEWTERAENWNTVQVLQECVKWTKTSN